MILAISSSVTGENEPISALTNKEMLSEGEESEKLIRILSRKVFIKD